MDVAQILPADVTRRSRPLYVRSRVTNRTHLFAKGVIDGRSPWVRRCRDILSNYISDLGGEANTSVAERSILRRASVLEVQLEQIELQFARAEQAGESASIEDVEAYGRIAANHRRLLESIGLQRRPRNVTPTINEYLAQRQNIDAEVIDG
jgi:hypothetical protein